MGGCRDAHGRLNAEGRPGLVRVVEKYEAARPVGATGMRIPGRLSERQRLLVLVLLLSTIVGAVGAGVAGGFLPPRNTDGLHVSAATAHVLIDLPEPSLAHRRELHPAAETLIVSWAAVQTARTRSMESATGLLYINVGTIAAGTILAAGLYFGAGLLV